MSKQINLTRGKSAIVDDDDYDRVNQFKWKLKVQKGRNGKIVKLYAERTVRIGVGKNAKKELIYLHRFILNAPAGIDCDHRNGNGLDCQKNNLRLCTTSQNSANAPNMKGKYKGVIQRGKRFEAYIGAGGYKSLGVYDTPEQAAAAYDKALSDAFGDFALTNLGPKQDRPNDAELNDIDPPTPAKCSKLTMRDVDAIRKEFASGISRSKLRTIYGVNQFTIHRICGGLLPRHLQQIKT
jgi:hypothetical protein